MRVVQLGPYPPPHGGVQTNLVAIREYLRAHGVACAAINITRHRRENQDEVYYPNNAWELLRLLARLPYDVVHLHIGGNLSARLMALSLTCAWMPGRTAVLTFHSGGYPSSPEGQRTDARSWRAFVLRQFDGVIAVNEEIAGFLARCGVPKERMRLVAPHVVRAPGTGSTMPEALERFFAAHDPALATVGLLEPEYDLKLQIEILGRVRERYPEAGLVIIGSGSLEDDLRQAIASKPYGSHVLLCGDVPHEATLTAIGRCGAFLRTTWYDGDSISVREALHLKTPVIATDNGMRPAGCHLIPAKQVEALFQAICEELDRPPRERGGEEAEGEENLEAVLRLYRELVKHA